MFGNTYKWHEQESHRILKFLCKILWLYPYIKTSTFILKGCFSYVSDKIIMLDFDSSFCPARWSNVQSTVSCPAKYSTLFFGLQSILCLFFTCLFCSQLLTIKVVGSGMQGSEPSALSRSAQQLTPTAGTTASPLDVWTAVYGPAQLSGSPPSTGSFMWVALRHKPLSQ